MRHRRKYKHIRLNAGVGINDADYFIGRCPYYAVWHSMLQRCYEPSFLVKIAAYRNCSVAPEWLLFSTFTAWMKTQDWQGKQLDKDLLVPGNKIYGPNTCLFISHRLNTLLIKRAKGAFPTGVSPYFNRFKVTFKRNRKTNHIGTYSTVEEAAAAYRNAKAAWIEEHAAQEPCPITRNALMNTAIAYRQGFP